MARSVPLRRRRGKIVRREQLYADMVAAVRAWARAAQPRAIAIDITCAEPFSCGSNEVIASFYTFTPADHYAAGEPKGVPRVA